MSDCPACGRRQLRSAFCCCGRQQWEVPAGTPELAPSLVDVMRFGCLTDTLQRTRYETVAMTIILTLQHLGAGFDRAVTVEEIGLALRDRKPDWAHNPVLALMDPQRMRRDGYLDISSYFPLRLRLTAKALLRLRVVLSYRGRL